VSLFDGPKFYENEPMTWRTKEKYGAVCGGISRMAVGACQARGVPAMTPFLIGGTKLLYKI